MADLRWLRSERSAYDAEVAHLVGLRDRLAAEAARRKGRDSWPISHDRWTYQTVTCDGHEVTVRWPSGAAEAAAEVVLDHRELDEGTGYLHVLPVLIDPTERWAAVAVDTVGAEEFRVRIRDLAGGRWCPDTIDGVSYGGLAWTSTGDALLYTVADATFRPAQVLRHRLGADQDDDEVVLVEDDPASFLRIRLTRSREWVLVEGHTRNDSQVWGVGAGGSGPAEVLVPRAVGRVVRAEHERGPEGGHLLLVSDHEHIESAVYRCSLPPGAPDSWNLVESPDPALRVHTVAAFAGALVMRGRRAGAPVLRVLPNRGPAYEVVPSLSAGTLRMLPQPRYDAASVTLIEESRVVPPQAESLRLADGARGGGGDLPDPRYVSERRFIDVGEVSVPVLISRAATTPLDGSAPALLYGYGAYETCFEPTFSPVLLGLLDRGIVFVDVHVRGGGELGRRWYLDGRMAAKTHTFDDYLAVADAIADRLVDGSRMATRGMSAGGLLQAVALTRRPDRWRAVIAEVPFVDVITAMSNPALPLTVNEWAEWGDPRVAEQRDWLAAYSPCDVVPAPDRELPALLVTGTIHDPRVLVDEPATWLRRLRGSAPARETYGLFRVELAAGSHDGPSGADGQIGYEAELGAWLLSILFPEPDHPDQGVGNSPHGLS